MCCLAQLPPLPFRAERPCFCDRKLVLILGHHFRIYSRQQRVYRTVHIIAVHPSRHTYSYSKGLVLWAGGMGFSFAREMPRPCRGSAPSCPSGSGTATFRQVRDLTQQNLLSPLYSKAVRIRSICWYCFMCTLYPVHYILGRYSIRTYDVALVFNRLVPQSRDRG